MKRSLPIIFLFLLFPLHQFAQSEGVNQSFNPNGFNVNIGPNGNINVIDVLPDGKMLLGGSFFRFNLQTTGSFVRVNADGTLDPGFDTGTGANQATNALAVLPNGKYLIGGLFTNYNGTSSNYLALLNPDGSLDESFVSGLPPSPDAFGVSAMAVQPDGKIIVAGLFRIGTSNRTLYRLNEDGSIDTEFLNGQRASGITDIHVLEDGKILLAGSFTTVDELPYKYLVLLDEDGEIEEDFPEELDINGRITKLEVLPDGKMLVAGAFTQWEGLARNRMARLNPDFSLDMEFNPAAEPDHVIQTFKLLDDGKIVVSGFFKNISGQPLNGIARLMPDGSLDAGFDPGTAFGGEVANANDIQLLEDGKLIIGGSFYIYNKINRSNLARINPDGSLDQSFNPQWGASPAGVNDVLVQETGEILIAGGFNNYNEVPIYGIARLNPNGTLDHSFDTGLGLGGGAFAVKEHQEGKLLVGGPFMGYNGQPKNFLVRINPDGSLDQTFNPGGSGPNSPVNDILVLEDGKILISGTFTGYNGGQTRRGIARLNANGTLDNTFTIGTGMNINSGIWSIGQQSDGKIIIAGDFVSFNGVSRNRIARLNPDGSLDETFNIGTGANTSIGQIIVQPDDKILVRGFFISSFNGSPVNRLFRLNADGSLDEAFTPQVAQNERFSKFHLQNDGKILLGRYFDTSPPTGFRLRLLKADGSDDPEFGVGFSANGRILGITTADDAIFITGDFTMIDDYMRLGIAKLFGEEVEVLSGLVLQVNPEGAGVPIGAGEYPVGTNVEVSVTANQGWVFVNWTEDGTVVSNDSIFNFEIPNAPTTLTANFEPSTTSLNEIHASELRVFPNPAIGKLWVAFNNVFGAEVKLQLVTMHGQAAHQLVIRETGKIQTSFDLAGLHPGIYFLVIQSENWNETRKVVVSH
jgi:uncharacterized delta-60 repeat protein